MPYSSVKGTIQSTVLLQTITTKPTNYFSKTSQSRLGVPDKTNKHKRSTKESKKSLWF